MVSASAGQNRGGAAVGKLVEWRDHCGSGGTGRRARLRILWPKGRGGSNPSFRTNDSIERSHPNVLFQALIGLDSRLGPAHNTWLERELPGEASPLPGRRA